MHVMKQVKFFLLGVLLSAATGGTWAADTTAAIEAEPAAASSGKLYHPSAEPLAGLAAKMALAKTNNRLLLVVLGGNWCHDSRALAARLYTAPLDTLVNASYETLFVDVGYLEKGRDVLTSLGIPVYYATPTVLIVDPVSGQVINTRDRHRWANASSIDMTESVAYFSQFAETGPAAAEAENDPSLETLLDEIDAFEQLQAERLYQAYGILGPMLKAYKEGNPKAFREDLWNEVRDYRYQVPADLDALRTAARERVASGETGIKLDYPVYPPFFWEVR